jgi:hypothetical protein
MKIIDKFLNITTNLEGIGLLKYDTINDDYKYFCTPTNAVVFATIGTDGIHFCIIPDENDKTLEYSPVYVINPMIMIPDHYVEIVAKNFYEFLSVVITAKDAGALECISYLEKERCLEHLQVIDNTYDKIKYGEAVAALSNEFNIPPIYDVYEYVKQLQDKTDMTKINYSEEYYEALGITNNSVKNTAEYTTFLFWQDSKDD